MYCRKLNKPSDNQINKTHAGVQVYNKKLIWWKGMLKTKIPNLSNAEQQNGYGTA